VLRVTIRGLGNVMKIRARDNGVGAPPGVKDELLQPPLSVGESHIRKSGLA
jgi:hypothetical protein